LSKKKQRSVPQQTWFSTQTQLHWYSSINPGRQLSEPYPHFNRHFFCMFSETELTASIHVATLISFVR